MNIFRTQSGRTRTAPALLALSMAIPLTACTGGVRQHYHTPEIIVPAHYGAGPSAHAHDAGGDLLREAASYPAGDALDDPWWQRFNDERLDRLVTRVLQVNTDLNTATLTLQRARLSAGLARNDLMPTLDAGVNGSYSKALDRGGSGDTSHSASASIGYELDLWGKLAAARDAADWEAQATAEDRESTVLSLAGTTCELYWTLAYQNQSIASGERSLEYAQKTLVLVQAQYSAGAVSQLEVHEVEQKLQSQRAALSTLQQQRVETRNALTVLLDGSSWPQDDEPQTLTIAKVPQIGAGVPAQLLGRRPDLRAAELRLRKMLADVDVTRTRYYPSFSLTGSIGGSSTSLSDVLKDPIGTLGGGVTLPFLHWREMKLNVDISEIDYEIAVNDFRKTLYTALGEVDDTLSDRQQLALQADAQQQSYETAAKIEQLYEVRYRAGAIALKTWLDAQETRRSTGLALAQARMNQLNNGAMLYQVLGGSDRASE